MLQEIDLRSFEAIMLKNCLCTWVIRSWHVEIVCVNVSWVIPNWYAEIVHANVLRTVMCWNRLSKCYLSSSKLKSWNCLCACYIPIIVPLVKDYRTIILHRQRGRWVRDRGRRRGGGLSLHNTKCTRSLLRFLLTSHFCTKRMIGASQEDSIKLLMIIFLYNFLYPLIG
jgi:hypothetical protein